mgnify:CR=1 FL=1
MKHLIISISILILSGCANTGARFNSSTLESAPDDKALVYFYRPSAFQGSAINFNIIANGVKIGELDNGAYTKRTLKPNTYKIHSKTMAIDRISTFVFEAGKTYFIRSFIEMGIWVSSIRFSLMHKDDALQEMRKSRIQLGDYEKDINLEAPSSHLRPSANVDKPTLSTSANKQESTLPINTIVKTPLIKPSIKQNSSSSKHLHPLKLLHV